MACKIVAVKKFPLVGSEPGYRWIICQCKMEFTKIIEKDVGKVCSVGYTQSADMVLGMCLQRTR